MVKRVDINDDDLPPHSPEMWNQQYSPAAATRNISQDEYLINDFDNNLPETCTLIYGPDKKSKIYLLGTSHFSLQSQTDVRIVMRNVKPHILMLELCMSRKELLQKDEATILKENENFTLSRLMQIMKEQGVLYGLIYTLFVHMTAQFTAQLGMAPGGEFRTAFQEAKRMEKVLVHMGDRPIQITLKRALAALNLWKKIKLFWHLTMSNTKITPEDVETCKKKDVLEQLLSELSKNFPELERVFIHERDMYMTHSLHLAINTVFGDDSDEHRRVVAVVGMGHVPGILERLGTNVEDHLAEIMTIPEPSKTTKVIKVTLKLTMLSCILWGCYKILPLPKFHK